MSIFNVNYSSLWKDGINGLTDTPEHRAWGGVLMKPLQYLHDLIFTDYIGGSNYPDYSILSAYTAGDRVIWNNRRVYESISGSTSGVTPFDASKWKEINRNYIGAVERARYNAQKLTYEYALNKWFQCSGIYITNAPVTNNAFLIGNSSKYSSTISSASTASATTVSYISSGFTGLTTVCYTIHIPTTVWTGISTTNTERQSIARSFADTINIAGMQYAVTYY